MTELLPHQKIVATKGEAVGKITGFSHLVLMCKDIDRSTRFYRDVLGLKVVRTQPEWREEYERQYFFELPNGELFSLYQTQAAVEPEQPLVSSLWPGNNAPTSRPQKLDHLAFNVDSMETLRWFEKWLPENGVEVSKIWANEPAVGFLAGRMYFYDPDGNPLEIATFDKSDPAWEDFDNRVWLREEHPVAALVAEALVDDDRSNG